MGRDARRRQFFRSSQGEFRDKPEFVGGEPEEPMSETPETPATPAATFSPEQFAQLIALLGKQQSGGGIDKDDLRDVLESSQKGFMKAMRPENETHPGKSHFSYPQGDVERPRPKIPWPTFMWNGYPQHKFPEELTWYELEIITGQRSVPDGNGGWVLERFSPGLQPGVYDCSMKDGRTTQKVEVKGTTNGNGDIEKLEVLFPVTRETKDQIPPVYVRAYQLVHGREHGSLMESYAHAISAYLMLQVNDEKAKRVPVG